MARPLHNPYPFTWEIPVGAAVACGVVFALGIHLGRAIACLASGQGFVWPAPAEFFTSLGGLLTGDAGAGLAQPATNVSPALLAGSLIGTELVLLVLVAWAGYELAARWGPAAPKGMASAGEAERLLGRSRLHRSRRIVRPDVYSERLSDAGRALS